MQVVWELQKAIYEKLSDTEESLIGNVSGIYHFVPQNTAFPYVVIADSKVTEISNFAENVYEIMVKVNLYDRGETNSDLLTVTDYAVVLLKDSSDFSLANHSVIDGRFVSLDVLLGGKDNDTWKSEVLFKFVVKEN
jgi:hypothetical protein